MALTRRQAVMAALGTIVLTGCSKTGRSYVRTRPSASWPGYPAGPTPSGGYTHVPPSYPETVVVPPPTQTPDPAGINAIARSAWTRSAPKRGQVNPMNGVNKITIHHEGWKVVDFTHYSTTADRIEQIRTVHVRDRGWGDIGYHFIVDRAGRVWEGRPLKYQGAHVSQNNEKNIGILVLGNFERQAPTSAQLKGLFETANQLTTQHNVKPSLVRSHKEIRATSCPGKNLQVKMNALRSYVA